MLHPSCHDEIMMEGERRWKAHGNTIRPRAGINSVGAFRRDAESCDRRDMLAGNEGVRSEASHLRSNLSAILSGLRSDPQEQLYRISNERKAEGGS